MRLVRFRDDQSVKIGALLGDSVIVLSNHPGLSEYGVLSIGDIIAGGAAVRTAIDKVVGESRHRLAVSDVEVLAPIDTTPHNVFCVGLNYVDHVKEGERIHGTAMPLPEVPHFFTKTSNTISAPDGPIPYWSRVTKALDYEVELALILSKGGRNISRADAFDHIFGYMVANDVSARDLQHWHGQWFKGKSLDGSLPLGPCIVTADEIADVRTLELSLTVNGELRQQAKVSDMIFDIATLIEQLSAGLTLSAGDVILTGTPSGIGAAMSPPRFLQPGDEVICMISDIGSLHGTVVESA